MKGDMSNKILSGLNPRQKEAILYNNGPLLVLAGAGSGKTKVITRKFSYLARKIPQKSIFTVTFTNKAADEMKGRIAKFSKNDMKDSWVGTFHSQCNRILRREIQHIGYRNDYTIYNDHDQSSLIRHILRDFKLYEALYKGVLNKISNLKSSLVSPEDFLSGSDGFGFEERLARVYVRYSDELKRCSALDFDDLIMLTIKLFEENPKVLKKYASAFTHILVDEFQDTNVAQYRLLKLLASRHNNICVVGDDDQSIYKFRGADVNNILNFQRDFPKTRTIKLEQNYRSTQNILDVSSEIIKHNPVRHEKKLWTDKGAGEMVYQCWLSTEEEESKHIAKVIRELYLKGVCGFNDFAVLYRVNPQSRIIEETFNAVKIPYRVIGGVSFYQRKEVRDLIAYVKFVMNHDDNVSLRRVINLPPRGIGASTITKIENHAKKQSRSLYATIKTMVSENGLTSTIKERLGAFVELIESLSNEKARDSADLLRRIMEKTGIVDLYDEDRAENIAELVSSASGVNLADFMDRLSLLTNLDDKTTGSAVSLLTLHSAKGLEFPVVFISGLEEGLLPYFKAKEPDELAEERRLLYVGMTRAKDVLWLTGANKRRLYAKVQEQGPSRFMADIPEACCKKFEKISRPSPVHSASSLKLTKVFKALNPYVVGSRVKHPKWGVGVIRDSDGEGDDQKVTVNFPNIGVKKLALRFAHLEKI